MVKFGGLKNSKSQALVNAEGFSKETSYYYALY